MDAGRCGRATEKAREAEAARDELREALAGVDVVLPSLGVDLVSLTSGYLSPLVELGCCRADVAWKLAAALRKCAQ
ncbi:hypothetical protein OG311_28110 [Streptomyces sp. NBC_01343]|uniref:hypothetical protein n=1 Tax=Streptomyces sp. NBC_01343 TaxID=2903832 RepID=UPI002E0FFE1B|nr:hypothetical protein OG311_28110 [Streptomyces sp. NBC_01343]